METVRRGCRRRKGACAFIIDPASADGAKVTAVRDGSEALAYLSEHVAPDVVVSDVRMPGRTGVDLLRELRGSGSGVPVVLITGFGQSVDPDVVEALGGAVILEKPFDFDDLRTALRNLETIARRRRTESPR